METTQHPTINTKSQSTEDPNEMSTLSRETGPVLRAEGPVAPSSSESEGKDKIPTKWMKYTLGLMLPKRPTASSSYIEPPTVSQSQESVVVKVEYPTQSEARGLHGSIDSYPTSSTLETSLIDRVEVKETCESDWLWPRRPVLTGFSIEQALRD